MTDLSALEMQALRDAKGCGEHGHAYWGMVHWQCDPCLALFVAAVRGLTDLSALEMHRLWLTPGCKCEISHSYATIKANECAACLALFVAAVDARRSAAPPDEAKALEAAIATIPMEARSAMLVHLRETELLNACRAYAAVLSAPPPERALSPEPESYPVLSIEWPDKWGDGSPADVLLTLITVQGRVGNVGVGDTVHYRRASLCGGPTQDQEGK